MAKPVAFSRAAAARIARGAKGEGRFCETLQVERLTGKRDADAPAVIAVPLQRGMIRVRR
jgi:hypothetical protein